ncbi:Uncharacterized protein TCM_005677 [Theobroma cacao]|uniref:Uncharacterized protein n=1 Tax=Theobroma cacao TaxID=3641 RepID=A0A061DVI7_THECC|nr:Uncharacterized protein TCM_005677 [Theobroma cacao]
MLMHHTEYEAVFFFFVYFNISCKSMTVMGVACAEQADFPSAERYNYLLDVLNTGSTSGKKSQPRTHVPESRFAASPIGSGISTVI